MFFSLKEKNYQFIQQIVWRFRFKIILLIMVATIKAVDVPLRPYIIKIILDRVENLSHFEIFQQLGPPALCYILITFFLIFINRLQNLVNLNLIPVLKKHIGEVLMDKLMGHSFNFYQNNFAGSLAAKINGCMTSIPRIIRKFTNTFYSHSLALFFTIIMVWQVNFKYAVGLIIWSLLFLIISVKLSYKAKKISIDTAEEASKGLGHMVDILSNMASVRFFFGLPYEQRFVRKFLKDYVLKAQDRDRYFMKLYVFQESTFAVFQAICLAGLIFGIKNQIITVGDFVLIITLNTSIIGLLWSLADDFVDFTEEFGNAIEGIRLINAPYEIKDRKTAKDLVVNSGKIVFENVWFNYKGTDPLFKSLNVSIEPGQKVGLVGYSGSGKTTFVNLLLRLFEISSGRILIDEQSISDATQSSLRQNISIISQDPSLFHRTLLENIRYGKQNATDLDVIEAAKKAHAHEFIEVLPQKYLSLVGERGIKLSGGQRQRIAIARAFLKGSPILILDEATSQLDSVTERIIQASLLQLMQGKTSLIIAHRLSTLLNMDRILVFQQGQIIEDGSHSNLLKLNGVYKKLWAAQVGGFLPETDQIVSLL